MRARASETLLWLLLEQGAEGSVGAYVNPHGFVHQTVTLRSMGGVALHGAVGSALSLILAFFLFSNAFLLHVAATSFVSPPQCSNSTPLPPLTPLPPSLPPFLPSYLPPSLPPYLPLSCLEQDARSQTGCTLTNGMHAHKLS